MFKSFASLAVAAVAADTDTPAEAPVTTGIYKYTKADAVTAMTTGDTPAAVCTAGINNQITYAGSTVVNQTNSFVSTSFALATGNDWTGNIGETAQVATCYMEGTKYMCTVSNYMVPDGTGTGAGSPGTPVTSVIMSTSGLTSKPTFDTTKSLDLQIGTSTCTMAIDGSEGCPGYVLNGSLTTTTDGVKNWAYNKVGDFATAATMTTEFAALQKLYADGLIVAVYYNSGISTAAGYTATNVVKQEENVVIAPVTPAAPVDPTPATTSAYAMAALGAGLALLSAF